MIGRGDVADSREGASLRSMVDSVKFFARSAGAIAVMAVVVILAGQLLGPIGWFLGAGLLCTTVIVVKALFDDRRYRQRLDERRQKAP